MGSKPPIIAGECGDIKWGSGDWIIVDMGFANTKKSCGAAIGSTKAQRFWFGDLVKKVIEEAQKNTHEELNLLLEAPLSMAFDHQKNPMRRSFEDLDHAWYRNSGAAMMLAAIRLIDRLDSTDRKREVRLFEAYAPLKDADHARVAAALREVVKQRIQERFVKPSDIAPEAKCLLPAYRLTNEDGKIPPVVLLLWSDYRSRATGSAVRPT